MMAFFDLFIDSLHADTNVVLWERCLLQPLIGRLEVLFAGKEPRERSQGYATREVR